MTKIGVGLNWLVGIWDAHSDREYVKMFKTQKEAEDYVTKLDTCLAHVCQVSSRWVKK